MERFTVELAMNMPKKALAQMVSKAAEKFMEHDSKDNWHFLVAMVALVALRHHGEGKSVPEMMKEFEEGRTILETFKNIKMPN